VQPYIIPPVGAAKAQSFTLKHLETGFAMHKISHTHWFVIEKDARFCEEEEEEDEW
jgi:hypothetical protein